MVALGVIFHAVGGFAAGSFYIPFKQVKNWAWECYWIVGGVFSWLVTPWIVAMLTVPGLLSLYGQAPRDSIFWCYFFGVLWGVGGLTFGLSMRYLGMSLGYALALGFCAAFGTILPPIYSGTFMELLGNFSGLTILAGVLVCLVGIAVCGLAGIKKEKELPEEKKTQTIREFNFLKGIWVAAFAGIMSACMAFAIASGKPIAQLAVERNVPSLWQNNAVLVIVMAGGFTTNFIWVVYLNIKNRTAGDYLNAPGAPLLKNYLFSALAGIVWFMQFMFYGMGTTKMGVYDFSSWTLHMAFIIVFSNVWGLKFHEWRDAGKSTKKTIVLGIAIVLLSILVIGAGNYLAATGR